VVSNVKDMSRVLRKMGFDVITGTNLSRRDLQTALHTFGERIKNADVSLFYYSGYLDQRRNASYIVPPADSDREFSPLVFRKVPILPLLKQMTIYSCANIVLLDACRSNVGQPGFVGVRSGAAKQKGCAALQPLTSLQRMMVVNASKISVKENGRTFGSSALAKSFGKYATRPYIVRDNMIKTVGKDVATLTLSHQSPPPEVSNQTCILTKLVQWNLEGWFQHPVGKPVQLWLALTVSMEQNYRLCEALLITINPRSKIALM